MCEVHITWVESFIICLYVSSSASNCKYSILMAIIYESQQRVFSNVFTLNESKSSDFFRFPSSDMVEFRALVTPCMPTCEPVQCDVLDYTGQTRTVDSYGKRRRRRSANNGLSLVDFLASDRYYHNWPITIRKVAKVVWCCNHVFCLTGLPLPLLIQGRSGWPPLSLRTSWFSRPSGSSTRLETGGLRFRHHPPTCHPGSSRPTPTVSGSTATTRYTVCNSCTKTRLLLRQCFRGSISVPSIEHLEVGVKSWPHILFRKRLIMVPLCEYGYVLRLMAAPFWSQKS